VKKSKNERRTKDIKKEEGRNERSRKEVTELEMQGKRHNMKQGRKAINKHKKRTFEIYLDVFISRPTHNCGCAIKPPTISWGHMKYVQKACLSITSPTVTELTASSHGVTGYVISVGASSNEFAMRFLFKFWPVAICSA
jgi:hypothetical protein